MSQVFGLRNRGIFAASLSITLASLGIVLYAARLAGQVPSGADAHPVHELRVERLATLRKIVDLVDQKHRHGSASMADLVLAKRNVAEAELELCTNPAERVMVFEKIVEDARILESQAEQLAQGNVDSQERALVLKAELLRSQVRLELARAELSNQLNGGGSKPPQVGWASPAAK
jgi:hypothetical protein